MNDKASAMHSPDPSAAPFAFELRFPSLSGAGRDLSFPCDASGSVQMDRLSARALNNYLLARALTGRDYGWPRVQALYPVQT